MPHLSSLFHVLTGCSAGVASGCPPASLQSIFTKAFQDVPLIDSRYGAICINRTCRDFCPFKAESKDYPGQMLLQATAPCMKGPHDYPRRMP